MFKKREVKRGAGRKGLVQIDWIISFGIFIVYIVWFFIVSRPIISSASVKTLPVDDIKDLFLENASWTVNQTPMIIKSNISASEMPIVMDFLFAGNEKSYGLKDRYWSIHDNKIFFLATFPAKKQIVTLLHSSENYSKPDLSNAFAPNKEFVRAGDMEAFFEDSMPSEVRFKESPMIRAFSITADGITFSPEKTVFSSDNILSAYAVQSNRLNNTMYILANNSRIISYLKGSNIDVRIKIELAKYDGYYIRDSEQAEINYNSSECRSFDTDYINFYDGDRGLTFLFSKAVDVRMCPTAAIDLDIDFSLNTSFRYDIVFHESGSDTRDLKHEYTAEYGMKNVLTGISEHYLYNLKNTNYSILKNQWSRGNEINITVLNATNDELFTVGETPRDYSQVKTLTYYTWVLDSRGNQSRAVLNIMAWR